MKVGINMLFLLPKKVGGTEPFTRGVIKALSKYDNKNEYVLFCNEENFNTFSTSRNVNKVRLPIKASNKPLRLVFEQLCFWYYVLKYKIELLYSFGYISPFFVPCKSIVNIFDLNWYYHPEDFGFLERVMWKFFVTNSARFADGITTSAYSSKKSIKEVLGVKKNVDVIYPGLIELEKPGKFEDLKILGVIKPYFFSIKAAYPHKNTIGLIRAFKPLIEKGYDCHLVIAGLKGKSSGDVEDYIKNNKLSGSVKILGWVSDKDMSTLYKFCTAFVFTSFYEGFGVSSLECFMMGIPLISSNAFSLNEVVGEGGVRIDPENTAGFTRQMEKVLIDKRYRNRLSKMAKIRGVDFDWKYTVKKLQNIFER